MTDYYLLLLLAALSAETVVPSYLPPNELGPIPASNIDAITNSQPKQQLQSISLDPDSVGGLDEYLGTGGGTGVSLNHDDRPVHPEVVRPGRRFYCCNTEMEKISCKLMLDIKTVIVKIDEVRANTACYQEVWDCPVVITTSFSTDYLRRDSYQTNEVLELLERYSIPALIWFYRCLAFIGDVIECVWPTTTTNYFE